MIALASALAALAVYGFFVHKRLLRYLHFYQQDEYDSVRFFRWLISSRAFDTRVSLALLLLAALHLATRDSGLVWLWQLSAATVFVGFGLREQDPTRAAKKPLVLTKRAKLIQRVALAICIAVGLLIALKAPVWGWLIAVHVAPFSLAAANFALQPIERRSQQFYWNDAHRRLLQIRPTVIGVTGSFGKTSVKHMLGHMLALNARAYITPGSVNTPMGVSRVIREQLPDDCKYFVVEMGAYGPGSITRLCNLTPPNMGIITAIGEAHYERFKDLDTVARAKFELAEAVLAQPAVGTVIAHSSVLANAYAHSFIDSHRAQFVLCGAAPSECEVRAWEQTQKGLAITLGWKGEDYRIEAPIYGAQHVGNLALAFGAAATLGIAPQRAIAALRSLPQIKHRLEVKPQADGSIIIDDAYNSNPIGFRAALELLSQIADGRRRILITPGMVELGEKHDELHAQLGALAAEHADVAVIVRAERIPSFVEGFLKGRERRALHTVASFSEASAWLRANGAPTDVVLLENDLPDLYERSMKL